MLTFITDVKQGEPDVLEGLEFEDLVIKSMEGETILILAAAGPWTHEKLVQLPLEDMIGEYLKMGACAYLGESWVGSTEV